MLDAHYANAIPLDLLKTEQDRITSEIASAEGRLAAVASNFKAAKTNLEQAPDSRRRLRCRVRRGWTGSAASVQPRILPATTGR